jgi:cation efflux family protein
MRDACDVASESKITVLVALAANLLIAVAKLVGGLVSGSSSMLAEAAHSVADTINQVFLLASIKVAARPPDPVHPFGYGKARFFWSLLAAVGIFVAGAIFSVYEGVHTLLHGGGGGGIVVPYVVLGVAFVAEGGSWLRALGQVRREAAAARRPMLRYAWESRDPTLKTVLSEDTAPSSAWSLPQSASACTSSPVTRGGTGRQPSPSGCSSPSSPCCSDATAATCSSVRQQTRSWCSMSIDGCPRRRRSSPWSSC